jgi:hypothetical protein
VDKKLLFYWLEKVENRYVVWNRSSDWNSYSLPAFFECVKAGVAVFRVSQWRALNALATQLVLRKGSYHGNDKQGKQHFASLSCWLD